MEKASPQYVWECAVSAATLALWLTVDCDVGLVGVIRAQRVLQKLIGRVTAAMAVEMPENKPEED